MNIDIRNYDHYRVTSHGGRSFDLFNRETGRVFSINTAQWAFTQTYGVDGCKTVEAELLGKETE